MHKLAWLVVVTGALAGMLGCEPPSAGTLHTSAPPPAVAAGAMGIEFAEVPVETATPPAPVAFEQTHPVAIATQSPATQITAAPEPTISSPAARVGTAVRLSAGVALPQLLPEGTQIGVSVDYRVTGRLNSSRHLLVIETSEGAIGVPVELSSQGGTLQGFCPLSVRPEHKPFRARIEELSASSQSRTPISNTLDLATSY